MGDGERRGENGIRMVENGVRKREKEREIKGKGRVEREKERGMGGGGGRRKRIEKFSRAVMVAIVEEDGSERGRERKKER